MSATVLFAPAAGPQIGGGHVMRDLSLATALTARGARCMFAVGDFGRRIVQRFAAAPMEVIGPGASAASVDCLVVDDFWLDAAGQEALRGSARRLVVVDDLADRALAADIVVDPSLGRTTADYDGKVRADAQLLLGPSFALLRPEFARLRPQTPPTAPAAIARVFVSFGLSDVDGVTARAVALVAAAYPHAEIDVALGPDAASLRPLQGLAAARGGLTVTVEATDVAVRLAQADLAVGAGGSATWERACLGVPTLSVIVADNQRDLARTLHADGRLIARELQQADFSAVFATALEQVRPAAVRSALGAAAWALCDGRGAERVAGQILEGL